MPRPLRLNFNLFRRIAATGIALGLWFWTQFLIGSRAPAVGIDDVLHDLTAGLNAYFDQKIGYGWLVRRNLPPLSKILWNLAVATFRVRRCTSTRSVSM